MKADLIFRPNAYGFGMDWTLVCTTKKYEKHFYLGQDSKVLRRLLGVDARTLAREINVSYPINVVTPHIRKKIARYIVQRLGLNGRNIKTMESWSLSAV